MALAPERWTNDPHELYPKGFIIIPEDDDEWSDEDGPPNDDWIHEAYLRQAERNDNDYEYRR